MAKIDNLLEQIKSLEEELLKEVQSQQEDFVRIREKNTKNYEQTSETNKQYSQNISDYIKKASIKNILSAPAIWIICIPVLLLDITVTIYQAICFPIYNIPKVKRSDYLVFDRALLNYLNIIEKINCGYCSYFNGIIAYIQEVAARTEQFWCPIKHARRLCTLHSRYQNFIDYGDAKSFRQHKEKVRRDFNDLN